MFGAYYFGWPYWADSPNPPIVPPPTPERPTYSYQTLVVPCLTKTICRPVETFEPRTLVLECRTRRCEDITGLDNVGDLQIYNLQDALFFNGTALSILINCPPGYQCNSSSAPLVFTYPPGTFQFPVPQASPGFPIYLSLRGCMTSTTFNSTGSTFTGTVTLQTSGCVVSFTLPAGSSLAAQQAAANAIIAEVARQQAYCDAAVQIGPGGQWPQNPPPPAPPPPATCPTWAVTWDAPLWIAGGSGNGTQSSFASGSGSGDHVSANTVANRGNLTTNLANAITRVYGSFYYSGPGCDCQVEIDYNQSDDGDEIGYVTIFDEFAVDVVFVNIAASYSGSGVVTVPFSMPDTGGVPKVFIIEAYSASQVGGANSEQHMNFTATFSNAP